MSRVQALKARSRQTDKLGVDTRADTLTHLQTRATTILESQKLASDINAVYFFHSVEIYY